MKHQLTYPDDISSCLHTICVNVEAWFPLHILNVHLDGASGLYIAEKFSWHTRLPLAMSGLLQTQDSNSLLKHIEQPEVFLYGIKSWSNKIGLINKILNLMQLPFE